VYIPKKKRNEKNGVMKIAPKSDGITLECSDLSQTLPTIAAPLTASKRKS
jgi:hypothetical protein